MSCDFGILNLENKISNKEASDLFGQLCDGDISGVTPSKNIENFYIEITSKHPEIDDILDEDVDNIELCPWSVAFDKSEGHLIISCVWPKADYVYELVADLAQKHELSIFSPQAELIVYPDGSEGDSNNPWWKFW